MESLSEQQREQLKKMSDERLRDSLRKAGMPDAAVTALDRPSLLAAWAELIAAGRDKPPYTASATAMPPSGDPDLEKQRLDFEERKWAQELELRKAEHQVREAELAAQQEQVKLETEKVKLEQERLRIQAENTESPAAQMKKYGDALRGTIGRMPTEPTDLPAFFDNAERLFRNIATPNSFRAQLLLPYLTDKARALVGRMDASKSCDYDEVKSLILREFKLTPWAYLRRYQTATKTTDETYVMFVSRLQTLLRYYITSRSVTKFDDLVSLLIADHVKPLLPSDCLKYVLSVENTTDAGWLPHRKLAEIIDTYIASRPSDDHSTARVSHIVSGTRQHNVGGIPPHIQQTMPAKSHTIGSDKPERRCFECDSRLHVVKHCPHHQKNTIRTTGSQFTAKPNTQKSSRVFVNTTTMSLPETHSPDTALKSGQTTHQETLTLHVSVDDPPHIRSSIDVSETTVLQKPFQSLDIHSLQYEVADLSYITVNIDGIEPPVKALHDSGAQISVIHPDIIKDILPQLPREGNVKLKGLFGDSVDAELISLTIKESHSSGNGISVILAMSDKVNNELILTDPVVQSLIIHSHQRPDDSNGKQANVLTDVISDTSDSESQSDSNLDTNDTTKMHTLNSTGTATTSELIADQTADPSLSTGWTLAQKGKGGYFIRDGILFHQGVVAGQNCEQLCVPINRRQHVLTLAHEVYGAHLGAAKTKDRIRLSFYWPTLSADCKQHCSSCEQCQKRARITVHDRVPITPIPRSEEIFRHWFIDCFGPLFPNQNVQYNYCLLMCDSASRWPAAYPLHSLTSKSICEALLKQFAITGIPDIISSDNASNFKGRLTQEFLNRLGCSPRFSTPNHPAACGLVERLVGTIKSAISKIATEHPKQWHTHLACILWALRESPNQTTGLPPWLLAFGRLPRGPLALLRDTWIGDEELPLNLGKSVTDYLQELKQRFQTVQSFAAEHAEKKQIQYTTRYNLRSHDKSFEIGEQVLILTPDSTSSKTFSRWKGPAVITVKKSPYSYIVDLNGTKMHVHANKLRKYNTRVQQVLCSVPPLHCQTAVIYEKDADFGDISVLDMAPSATTTPLPSQRIEPKRLAHLEPAQRQELLTLLDRFSDCFSDTPGFCSLVEHTVPLTDNFIPKRLAPYKIPIKLRPEVQAQLHELQSLGIIRPSKSPMASPVICVLKGADGKGGVRLAIDYRYVNKFTISDAYPTPDLTDIVQEVGNARYISTFDATKGYYQTPVREQDRWLTAFICEFGLFEFTRTPFGMRSSGATFMRAVQQALQPVHKFTASYVDDMSVYSGAWQAHVKHLEKFLLEIRKSGLTMNLAKCNFALPQVKFVGQIIGSGIRKPNPERLAAVQNLSPPCDKRQLRQVIGLFSYFREYIPNFAELAHPLTELTKRGVPDKIPWGDKEQTAFDELKSLLCQAVDTTLSIIDIHRPYRLYVDASDHTVAGILAQQDDNGHDRPVAFASVKLNPRQRSWATIEKEAYAAIWALQKFRRWVFWSPVTVLSDHNPLTYLTQSSPRSSKLMRWALALQEYDLRFEYKEGKNNAAADCLSRM